MSRYQPKSKILLSIFKRKGGEGSLTKIINNENKSYYLNQISLLDEDENPIICFKENELNWLLLTNRRILSQRDYVKISIPFVELLETHIALNDELKKGKLDKNNLTNISLKDNMGNSYVINVEKGDPFNGIYQILHHISANNKT